MILLSGDFRQTLPVIPRCRRNKRLPQIIESMALCEKISADNKHESCIA